MSRRPPNPNAERAAANQQALKTLVKLESNKSCADCKKNKHPRWASWNLGIFVCIRCSGIHRGMGTHISRVKSVDLDAWTDEQLASMLRWGNARANTYWEAKLAPGHVPSDAKIENFIRTKYDSKRWVMDGPIPDPATLDVAEEDHGPAPASAQQTSQLGRSASLHAGPGPTAAAAAQSAPPRRANPGVDLFGDVPTNSAASTTSRQAAFAAAPPKPQAAPRAPPKASESLLGFDFFNAHTQTGGGPGRPSSAAASIPSATSASAGPSRPDLKQSILSLYASSSKASTPTASIPATSPPTSSAGLTSQGMGSLSSDFGGLSFGAPPPAKAATTTSSAFSSPLSNFASPLPSQGQQPHMVAKPLSGGGFFDSKPATNAASSAVRPGRAPEPATSPGFGDFESATSPGWGSPEPASQPTANTASAAATSRSNGMGDMFDFSAPGPASPTKPAPPSSSNFMDSAFNLSAPKPSAPKPSQPTTVASSGPPIMDDPWGSSNAWDTPAAAPAPSSTAAAKPAPSKVPVASGGGDDWGWGGSGAGAAAPPPPAVPTKSNEVTADEDFGGWESYTSGPAAATTPKASSSAAKPAGGFGGNDNDLFSNVWG